VGGVRVGVIGAGVMGAGTAQVLATHGCEVVNHDMDHRALDDARRVIEDGRFGLAQGVRRGKLSAEVAEAARARLSFSAELDEAAGRAELVIEAIPEILEAKVALFRALDRECPATRCWPPTPRGCPSPPWRPPPIDRTRSSGGIGRHRRRCRPWRRS
jgi:3-hydroxybutyryl-CoA dehydrogenase